MKQTQRVTANYAADLAGVCSALYEIGRASCRERV